MMINGFKLAIAGAVVLGMCVYQGMAQEGGDVAPLYELRDGVPNVAAKLKAGKPVTVVYFGGSITAANGWRVQTHQWLNEQFPASSVKMINAGVGGTGSQLGVFRMDQDVLAHNPDLVFVEFAVNDGQDAIDKPDQVERAIEGIVRKIRKQNATIDICFLYTYHKRMSEQYHAGKTPKSIEIMETLANHYGIATVNGGLKAFQLAKEGKWNVPGVKAAKTAPRFSKDDCHPTPKGHRVFTDLICEVMGEMLKPSTASVAHAALAPLRTDSYEAAQMLIPSKAVQFSPEWKKVDAGRFRQRMPELWTASTPGATATVTFKGAELLFFDLIGPNTGQYSVTVDGEDRGVRVRFDKWSRNPRQHWGSVIEGLDADKTHVVTITVLPDPPVAARNPKMKSKGTTIKIGGVMLLGKLVNQKEKQ